MKDEFLESLAQLEQNLKKLDSARTMVEQTVNAYKDVSVDLKSYTKSLSDTGDAIRNLIGELKTNKDNLSSGINSEMQKIITKFESSVTKFETSAAGLQVTFESQSNSLISTLSGDLAKSAKNLATSTAEIQKQFDNSTEQTISKLDKAVSAFSDSVKAFDKSVDERFKAISEEHLLILKNQKILLIVMGVVGAISLINMVLLFVLK